MSNKQPRRQHCQPKIYTESDFRKALREALMSIEKHHTQMCVGSFALALHRKLGLDSDKIADVLVATNEYSLNALCFTDVQKELLEETGLDLDDCTDDLF